MANKILTADGWQQRIRDRFGIDAAYLPDSAIEQPDCITVAEANIIEQIPNYASLDGNKKVYLEAAVVCECCILLCPGMSTRLPKKEQGPHASHELTIDWDKKKTEFIEERNKYILEINPIPFSFGFRLSN